MSGFLVTQSLADAGGFSAAIDAATARLLFASNALAEGAAFGAATTGAIAAIVMRFVVDLPSARVMVTSTSNGPDGRGATVCVDMNCTGPSGQAVLFRVAGMRTAADPITTSRPPGFGPKQVPVTMKKTYPR